MAIGGKVNLESRCFDRALSMLRPETAQTLCKDCEAAFTARETGVGEELPSGCTFWVAADARPTSALERLALDIFSFHARNAEYDARRSGVRDQHEPILFTHSPAYSMCGETRR